MVHSGSKDPKPEKISTGSRPNCGHEKTQEDLCVTCFNANRTKCTLKRYLPSYIDRHREHVHQKTEIDVISYGDPRAVPILKALRSDPHVKRPGKRPIEAAEVSPVVLLPPKRPRTTSLSVTSTKVNEQNQSKTCLSKSYGSLRTGQSTTSDCAVFAL